MTTMEPPGSNLTEGAMALIETVVERSNITDPKKLLPEVCAELMDRFEDHALEYHLHQMNLRTTRDIKRAISCFFISKKLFPQKSYTRAAKYNPQNKGWNKQRVKNKG